ncbi:hypothetical protein RB597_009358 [Gaeumannomyces tritici]
MPGSQTGTGTGTSTGTKQLTEADRIRIRALAFDAGYTRSQIRDRTGASVAQVKLALKCQTPVPRSGRPPKDPSNPKRRKRGPRSVPTPALKPARFERGPPGLSAAESMAEWAAAAEAARSGEAAEEAATPEGFQLLVLNPNSSTGMTEGVKKAIESSVTPNGNTISYYTAPEPSPASINDGFGLARSTEVVLADLQAKAAARDAEDAEADGDAGTNSSGSGNHDELDGYDGVLVACFSVHPLVAHLAERHRGRRVVLGILEASVLAALALTNPYPRCPESPGRTWGIVTTGAFWEAHLEDGVRRFLDASYSASFSSSAAGGPNAAKFAGVYTTGLDAGDFHGGVGPEVVRAKLKDATKRLLAFGRVGCVVMGCAGMAGLEDVIRSAIAEEYGEPQTPQEKVYIIDGVKAGVGLLAETIRNERMFGQ